MDAEKSQEEIKTQTNEEEKPKQTVDYLKQPHLKASLDFGRTFTKGCRWSPDGLCILLCSDDHSLKIFDLPQEDKDENFGKPAVDVKEGENVYDYQWYPFMNSSQPDSCCFAVTSQFHPIHLYDAFDGHIRGTYRIYDHVDEVVAARSLCFNPSGDKLVAGLKNQIRIFDVAVPGRDCEMVKTFDKKEGGLPGIVSSIAFNPMMENIFALASYAKSAAVYLDPRAQLLCVLEGQKGGITQIKFSPDGSKLVAGSRKDKEILIWDMRNPGDLFAVLHRQVDTNQRIYFDFDQSGRYIFSGSTDGSLSIWDLEKGVDSDTNVLDKAAHFEKIHDDAVNGCSVHPYLPMIATSSGQRHISLPPLSDDEEPMEEDIETAFENKLKLWSFPYLQNADSINA